LLVTADGSCGARGAHAESRLTVSIATTFSGVVVVVGDPSGNQIQDVTPFTRRSPSIGDSASSLVVEQIRQYSGAAATLVLR